MKFNNKTIKYFGYLAVFTGIAIFIKNFRTGFVLSDFYAIFDNLIIPAGSIIFGVYLVKRFFKK